MKDFVKKCSHTITDNCITLKGVSEKELLTTVKIFQNVSLRQLKGTLTDFKTVVLRFVLFFCGNTCCVLCWKLTWRDAKDCDTKLVLSCYQTFKMRHERVGCWPGPQKSAVIAYGIKMEAHLVLSILGACCVYPNRLDFCQRIAASSSPLIPRSAFSATITGNFFVL